MSISEGCLWATMPSFDHIEMHPRGREEVLDDITEDFPYLAVLSQHDRFHERTVPWHWHQELELFYVLEGGVDYATPHERRTLVQGSAGMVNANVLHMTRATGGRPNANLLVHMPRPQLLAERGGRIWRRYVEPLLEATSIELLVVEPGEGVAGELPKKMRRSFETAAREEEGWELRLRDELSEIWLDFLELARPRLGDGPAAMPRACDERLRLMLDYVGRHYAERLSVADIAASAYTSERECHRTFRETLGLTPAQYLRDYRIQQACRMLAHTTRPVSAVGEMSGLGTASHFGQVFRAEMGCTPSEYRSRWQDSDTRRQHLG